MAKPGAPLPQVETMPPSDACLISKNEKIETPTDERGLVDVPKLLQLVKATVDLEYTWPGQANTHHFYWPERWYPKRGTPQMTETYSKFRDLPVHKGWLPTVFHNWLHLITIPPPVPDFEAIMYRMESWRVAESLFKRAQTQGFRFERKLARQRKKILEDNPELKRETAGQSKIAQAVMYNTLEQFFLKPDEPRVKQVKSLLSEVCVVERLDNRVDNAKELARRLGLLMTRHSIELVPAVAKR